MLIRGLYGITPQGLETDALVQKVRAAAAGGMRVLQYRYKQPVASAPLEKWVYDQALKLRELCRDLAVVYLINDYLELALQVDADGLHMGQQEGEVSDIRQALGSKKILGVSCYEQLPLAQAALKAGADYVAFGAMYASVTKPQAVRARPELLTEARSLGLPVVAIGGIALNNAAPLIQAGADALAVIDGLFNVADVEDTARGFSALFEVHREK